MPDRKANPLTLDRLVALIDHTLLAADHTIEDVERVCREAVDLGFAAVSVCPYDVPRAARLLKGSPVRVGGTVGIPLGHSGLKVKCAAAAECVEGGAHEIDMVLNLIAMKSGRYGDVRDEIAAVRRVSAGHTLKVILETCYLSDEEKARAAELAVDAGADFVKTSTGWGPAGATAEDVRLLARIVGDRARVKAAGGIRTVADVARMVEAGASRIGTSAGVAIVRELQESEDV